jgi:NAD(P)-dependent dehydrogenase (short-subunit alcohol dehydrogenase family)
MIRRRQMNEVIVITGASRGIGAATARLAAERGYHVCVNYRARESEANALVQELSRSTRAIAVRADVSVERDVLALFDRVDRELGPLSALVNNAGIVEPQSRLESVSAERLQRVLGVNVIGTLLCSREAVRRMSRARGGRGGAIVNLSSMAARLGSPNEFVDYAASKGAVDALTIGLAREVAAEGIRVNAVRPGLIHTEMHASGGEPRRVERLTSQVPMQRGGEAEEVARAILWLLSDEASYTTGAFIDVSGGR